MDTQSTKEVASAHAAHREREHFFSAAKVVAGLTVLSRIAGMLRATAIATLGATEVTDAFGLAWKIPNLFRRLFAEGALSAAFVPVFTETVEKEQDGLAKAGRLLSNAMALLALLTSGIMVLLLVALTLWAWLWPGPQDRQLMILLAAIQLPFMVTICLLALASAALNCRGRFIYPAATPIILNVVIILGVWLVAPFWKGRIESQLVVIAASVSVAGVIQFAGVLWFLKRSGFSLRWNLRPLQPGIGPIVRLMAPMLLGLGFLQFSELAESGLAWVLRYKDSDPTLSIFGWELVKPLSGGVIQRIDNARYLYQFPMGVLAISLGVAVFPLLSRYAARNDMPNLRDSVNRALRLSFMEGMATGTGLFILAQPITSLLFRYGRYTAADVATTAFILQMYVSGMWAYCTYQIVVRAFYALKDTRTPLIISCILAFAHLVLVATLVWIPSLHAGAFGIATAITFGVNTLVLATLLRRKIGRIGGRKLVASFAKSIIACAVMAAALWGIQYYMQGKPSWLQVAVSVPAGAMVFIAVAAMLQAPELGELFGAIRRKTAVPETSTDAV